MLSIIMWTIKSDFCIHVIKCLPLYQLYFLTGGFIAMLPKLVITIISSYSMKTFS